ncbi:hypothetical protein ACHAXR_002587 [Thalassiosira sp. AJA248-18]
MELIVDFPQPRQRVSFHPHIEVRFVENLAVNHKADLYFSEYNIKSFRYQTKLTLKQISSKMTMAQYAEMNVSDTSTFMGLENYLSESTPRKITGRRRAVVKAVCMEQQRQVEAGVSDQAKMANVAQAESEVSLRRAQIIALLHSDKR